MERMRSLFTLTDYVGSTLETADNIIQMTRKTLSLIFTSGSMLSFITVFLFYEQYLTLFAAMFSLLTIFINFKLYCPSIEFISKVLLTTVDRKISKQKGTVELNCNNSACYSSSDNTPTILITKKSSLSSCYRFRRILGRSSIICNRTAIKRSKNVDFKRHLKRHLQQEIKLNLEPTIDNPLFCKNNNGLGDIKETQHTDLDVFDLDAHLSVDIKKRRETRLKRDCPWKKTPVPVSCVVWDTNKIPGKNLTEKPLVNQRISARVPNNVYKSPVRSLILSKEQTTKEPKPMDTCTVKTTSIRQCFKAKTRLRKDQEIFQKQNRPRQSRINERKVGHFVKEKNVKKPENVTTDASICNKCDAGKVSISKKVVFDPKEHIIKTESDASVDLLTFSGLHAKKNSGIDSDTEYDIGSFDHDTVFNTGPSNEINEQSIDAHVDMETTFNESSLKSLTSEQYNKMQKNHKSLKTRTIPKSSTSKPNASSFWDRLPEVTRPRKVSNDVIKKKSSREKALIVPGLERKVQAIVKSYMNFLANDIQKLTYKEMEKTGDQSSSYKVRHRNSNISKEEAFDTSSDISSVCQTPSSQYVRNKADIEFQSKLEKFMFNTGPQSPGKRVKSQIKTNRGKISRIPIPLKYVNITDKEQTSNPFRQFYNLNPQRKSQPCQNDKDCAIKNSFKKPIKNQTIVDDEICQNTDRCSKDDKQLHKISANAFIKELGYENKVCNLTESIVHRHNERDDNDTTIDRFKSPNSNFVIDSEIDYISKRITESYSSNTKTRKIINQTNKSIGFNKPHPEEEPQLNVDACSERKENKISSSSEGNTSTSSWHSTTSNYKELYIAKQQIHDEQTKTKLMDRRDTKCVYLSESLEFDDDKCSISSGGAVESSSFTLKSIPDLPYVCPSVLSETLSKSCQGSPIPFGERIVGSVSPLPINTDPRPMFSLRTSSESHLPGLRNSQASSNPDLQTSFGMYSLPSSPHGSKGQDNYQVNENKFISFATPHGITQTNKKQLENLHDGLNQSHNRTPKRMPLMSFLRKIKQSKRSCSDRYAHIKPRDIQLRRYHRSKFRNKSNLSSSTIGDSQNMKAMSPPGFKRLLEFWENRSSISSSICSSRSNKYFKNLKNHMNKSKGFNDLRDEKDRKINKISKNSCGHLSSESTSFFSINPSEENSHSNKLNESINKSPCNSNSWFKVGNRFDVRRYNNTWGSKSGSNSSIALCVVTPTVRNSTTDTTRHVSITQENSNPEAQVQVDELSFSSSQRSRQNNESTEIRQTVEGSRANQNSLGQNQKVANAPSDATSYYSDQSTNRTSMDTNYMNMLMQPMPKTKYQHILHYLNLMENPIDSFEILNSSLSDSHSNLMYKANKQKVVRSHSNSPKSKQFLFMGKSNNDTDLEKTLNNECLDTQQKYPAPNVIKSQLSTSSSYPKDPSSYSLQEVRNFPVDNKASFICNINKKKSKKSQSFESVLREIFVKSRNTKKHNKALSNKPTRQNNRRSCEKPKISPIIKTNNIEMMNHVTGTTFHRDDRLNKTKLVQSNTFNLDDFSNESIQEFRSEILEHNQSPISNNNEFVQELDSSPDLVYVLSTGLDCTSDSEMSSQCSETIEPRNRSFNKVNRVTRKSDRSKCMPSNCEVINTKTGRCRHTTMGHENKHVFDKCDNVITKHIGKNSYSKYDKTELKELSPTKTITCDTDKSSPFRSLTDIFNENKRKCKYAEEVSCRDLMEVIEQIDSEICESDETLQDTTFDENELRRSHKKSDNTLPRKPRSNRRKSIKQYPPEHNDDIDTISDLGLYNTTKVRGKESNKRQQRFTPHSKHSTSLGVICRIPSEGIDENILSHTDLQYERCSTPPSSITIQRQHKYNDCSKTFIIKPEKRRLKDIAVQCQKSTSLSKNENEIKLNSPIATKKMQDNNISTVSPPCKQCPTDHKAPRIDGEINIANPRNVNNRNDVSVDYGSERKKQVNKDSQFVCISCKRANQGREKVNNDQGESGKNCHSIELPNIRVKQTSPNKYQNNEGFISLDSLLKNKRSETTKSPSSHLHTCEVSCNDTKSFEECLSFHERESNFTKRLRQEPRTMVDTFGDIYLRKNKESSQSSDTQFSKSKISSKSMLTYPKWSNTTSSITQSSTSRFSQMLSSLFADMSYTYHRYGNYNIDRPSETSSNDRNLSKSESCPCLNILNIPPKCFNLRPTMQKSSKIHNLKYMSSISTNQVTKTEIGSTISNESSTLQKQSLNFIPINTESKLSSKSDICLSTQNTDLSSLISNTTVTEPKHIQAGTNTTNLKLNKKRRPLTLSMEKSKSSFLKEKYLALIQNILTGGKIDDKTQEDLSNLRHILTMCRNKSRNANCRSLVGKKRMKNKKFLRKSKKRSGQYRLFKCDTVPTKSKCDNTTSTTGLLKSENNVTKGNNHKENKHNDSVSTKCSLELKSNKQCGIQDIEIILGKDVPATVVVDYLMGILKYKNNNSSGSQLSLEAKIKKILSKLYGRSNPSEKQENMKKTSDSRKYSKSGKHQEQKKDEEMNISNYSSCKTQKFIEITATENDYRDPNESRVGSSKTLSDWLGDEERKSRQIKRTKDLIKHQPDEFNLRNPGIQQSVERKKERDKKPIKCLLNCSTKHHIKQLEHNTTGATCSSTGQRSKATLSSWIDSHDVGNAVIEKTPCLKDKAHMKRGPCQSIPLMNVLDDNCKDGVSNLHINKRRQLRKENVETFTISKPLSNQMQWIAKDSNQKFFSCKEELVSQPSKPIQRSGKKVNHPNIKSLLPSSKMAKKTRKNRIPPIKVKEELSRSQHVMTPHGIQQNSSLKIHTLKEMNSSENRSEKLPYDKTSYINLLKSIKQDSNIESHKTIVELAKVFADILKSGGKSSSEQDSTKISEGIKKSMETFGGGEIVNKHTDDVGSKLDKDELLKLISETVKTQIKSALPNGEKSPMDHVTQKTLLEKTSNITSSWSDSIHEMQFKNKSNVSVPRRIQKTNSKEIIRVKKISKDVGRRTIENENLESSQSDQVPEVKEELTMKAPVTITTPNNSVRFSVCSKSKGKHDVKCVKLSMKKNGKTETDILVEPESCQQDLSPIINAKDGVIKVTYSNSLEQKDDHQTNLQNDNAQRHAQTSTTDIKIRDKNNEELTNNDSLNENGNLSHYKSMKNFIEEQLDRQKPASRHSHEGQNISQKLRGLTKLKGVIIRSKSSKEKSADDKSPIEKIGLCKYKKKKRSGSDQELENKLIFEEVDDSSTISNSSFLNEEISDTSTDTYNDLRKVSGKKRRMKSYLSKNKNMMSRFSGITPNKSSMVEDYEQLPKSKEGKMPRIHYLNLNRSREKGPREREKEIIRFEDKTNETYRDSQLNVGNTKEMAENKEILESLKQIHTRLDNLDKKTSESHLPVKVSPNITYSDAVPVKKCNQKNNDKASDGQNCCLPQEELISTSNMNISPSINLKEEFSHNLNEYQIQEEHENRTKRPRSSFDNGNGFFSNTHSPHAHENGTNHHRSSFDNGNYHFSCEHKNDKFLDSPCSERRLTQISNPIYEGSTSDLLKHKDLIYPQLGFQTSTTELNELPVYEKEEWHEKMFGSKVTPPAIRGSIVKPSAISGSRRTSLPNSHIRNMGRLDLDKGNLHIKKEPRYFDKHNTQYDGIGSYENELRKYDTPGTNSIHSSNHSMKTYHRYGIRNKSSLSHASDHIGFSPELLASRHLEKPSFSSQMSRKLQEARDARKQRSLGLNGLKKMQNIGQAFFGENDSPTYNEPDIYKRNVGLYRESLNRRSGLQNEKLDLHSFPADRLNKGIDTPRTDIIADVMKRVTSSENRLGVLKSNFSGSLRHKNRYPSLQLKSDDRLQVVNNMDLSAVRTDARPLMEDSSQMSTRQIYRNTLQDNHTTGFKRHRSFATHGIDHSKEKETNSMSTEHLTSKIFGEKSLNEKNEAVSPAPSVSPNSSKGILVSPKRSKEKISPRRKVSFAESATSNLASYMSGDSTFLPQYRKEDTGLFNSSYDGRYPRSYSDLQFQDNLRSREYNRQLTTNDHDKTHLHSNNSRPTSPPVQNHQTRGNNSQTQQNKPSDNSDDWDATVLNRLNQRSTIPLAANIQSGKKSLPPFMKQIWMP